MAHPFDKHRDHHVQHSRVGHIAHGHKHRAEGGRVHEDAAQDRKLIGKMLHDHDRKAEGKKAKHRHDRPMRAKGGRVGKNKKGATHVNVIVNGGHPSPAPVPVPMAPPPMGGPAPPPPAGLGGPAPGMGGPPTPPPGMPPRKRGGRVKHREDGGSANIRDMVVRGRPKDAQGKMLSEGDQSGPPVAVRRGGYAKGGPIYAPPHTAKPKFARGGAAKSGPAWDEGKKAGTQVQHSDGHGATNTKANLDRGRVVTFRAGGQVKSFRARGGRTEAPGPGKGMGPDLEAGSISGEARLEKAGRARSRYSKPMKGRISKYAGGGPVKDLMEPIGGVRENLEGDAGQEKSYLNNEMYSGPGIADRFYDTGTRIPGRQKARNDDYTNRLKKSLDDK